MKKIVHPRPQDKKKKAAAARAPLDVLVVITVWAVTH